MGGKAGGLPQSLCRVQWTDVEITDPHNIYSLTTFVNYARNTSFTNI